MKIKVMTVSKSFMEECVKKHSDEIKIEGIKQIILSLANERLFKKITNDLCAQALQDFEKGYYEANQRMSVFASFFNERSIKDGEPFFKLTLDSEINNDDIDSYINIEKGNEKLHFLIADSFAHIPAHMASDESFKTDINNTISEILKGFIDGSSEQAIKLLMKTELSEKEDDILLALAFGVYGPALSEIADELLPEMKEYIKNNKDGNSKK
ncbi:MAG: hypothetical protein ACRCXX_13625 [Cetobacterium sp.]|uniref:hypothetical protein n=1 Tax=Cetobacterium sp. TaxID=2071632 RepID=UPI003F2EC7E0